MQRNQPWYCEWEEQCSRAWDSIVAYDNRQTGISVAYENEARAYFNYTLFKLIYESNLMENAGLSEGDTRKIILDEGVRSPDMIKKLNGAFEEFTKRIKREAQPPANPAVVFRGKQKGRNEIISHLRSLYAAIIKSIGVIRSHAEIEDPLHEIINHRNNRSREMSGKKSEVELFSETEMRLYHYLMADGLMPPDAGIPAGYYRIDNRTTDFQASFVSWQNVPLAMKRFIRDSNKTIRSDENPIYKAARISYDFVGRIHPFPDFNGRMSRLIINMVLTYEGLPFLTILKGNKKEKHRYLYSLRRANNGDLNPYACLIARAVNQGFEQLNQKLEAAGLDPIRLTPPAGKTGGQK